MATGMPGTWLACEELLPGGEPACKGEVYVRHPNRQLRAARLRTLSHSGSGRHMSRQEVAEAVNAYIFVTTERVARLNAHYVSRLERGHRRWPNPEYRGAFRAVLGADTDAELGFYVIHRRARRS
jgi:hypothetical protein